MREALTGVCNADQLHTDFYDRTRLATWVRRHPGLITWVKEKVGRAFVGWRPYGSWTGGQKVPTPSTCLTTNCVSTSAGP